MRAYLFLFLLLAGCANTHPKPGGSYLGLLAMTGITYHLFLDNQGPAPVLYGVTFKADPLPLDTIYFKGDSLHFRMKEYYSEYKGRFDAGANRIEGIWIGEDSLAHPLVFQAVMPDTVSGLHPRSSPGYTYQKPALMGDGIKTDTREAQKLSPAVMDSVIKHLVNGKYKDVHSLLVARNNELVVEEYFYRFNRDKVYNIQSATKNVVSALTGIALEKKELKSTQQTLCTSLPGYEKWACDEKHKNITLHQLLTMSTGIAWDEQTYDYGDERNTLVKAASDSDQFVHLFLLPREIKATPVFAYNSLNHILMNAVLRHATHMENKDELTTRLLQPLGIEKCYIDEPTPMGAIGDIGLRPRDMLKFGLLYANQGQWNGQQVVPAHWVAESIRPKIQPRPGLGYGYFWWTKDFEFKGKTVSSFFAWGYGGQYIFVVPALQLVVVMSGSHWGTDPVDQGIPIMEEILKAVEE
ncbi:serine hydrolase domain-containing protein [Chryseolinea soli]|uniref:Class C beta-lactamase-related serine hydrolase n=1 Tax=Chryseolinea soli TaxID=2321403 RepID=A0A385SPS1_9BACT|nr:serine hydrolase [Chryseolinea soli]AYB32536.1 class C beta-lactamase-related serine hydrolase [Chryseolinea soli]